MAQVNECRNFGLLPAGIIKGILYPAPAATECSSLAKVNRPIPLHTLRARELRGLRDWVACYRSVFILPLPRGRRW
jgi:hypothetical protein